MPVPDYYKHLSIDVVPTGQEVEWDGSSVELWEELQGPYLLSAFEQLLTVNLGRHFHGAPLLYWGHGGWTDWAGETPVVKMV